MHTYLVSLADRNTLGEGRLAEQRILVQAKTDERMQEFVDTLTGLEISNPVVTNIRKLAIKRPPPRTVLHSAVKTAAV